MYSEVDHMDFLGKIKTIGKVDILGVTNAAIKHHDQKQCGQDSVYFILHLVFYH